MAEWAPYIFAKTDKSDFQHLVHPFDFYERGSPISKADEKLTNQRDPGHYEWVSYSDGQHVVFGVACFDSLLAGKEVKDNFGRPNRGFFGFVAREPVTEIPVKDIDTIKRLFAEMQEAGVFDSKTSDEKRRAFTSGAYNLNLPTEARTSHNVVRIAAASETVETPIEPVPRTAVYTSDWTPEDSARARLRGRDPDAYSEPPKPAAKKRGFWAEIFRK